MRESPELAARRRLPSASWARARCAQGVWGLPELSSEFAEGEIPIANEVQSH